MIWGLLSQGTTVLLAQSGSCPRGSAVAPRQTLDTHVLWWVMSIHYCVILPSLTFWTTNRTATGNAVDDTYPLYHPLLFLRCVIFCHYKSFWWLNVLPLLGYSVILVEIWSCKEECIGECCLGFFPLLAGATNENVINFEFCREPKHRHLPKQSPPDWISVQSSRTS